MLLTIAGALVSILGLLMAVVSKVYRQGEAMGRQEEQIVQLLDEVRTLRTKADSLSGLVQRLVTIEEQRH